MKGKVVYKESNKNLNMETNG